MYFYKNIHITATKSHIYKLYFVFGEEQKY